MTSTKVAKLARKIQEDNSGLKYTEALAKAYKLIVPSFKEVGDAAVDRKLQDAEGVITWGKLLLALGDSVRLASAGLDLSISLVNEQGLEAGLGLESTSILPTKSGYKYEEEFVERFKEESTTVPDHLEPRMPVTVSQPWIIWFYNSEFGTTEAWEAFKSRLIAEFGAAEKPQKLQLGKVTVGAHPDVVYLSVDGSLNGAELWTPGENTLNLEEIFNKIGKLV